MGENNEKLLVLGAAIIGGYLLYNYSKKPEIIINANTLSPTKPSVAVNQQQLENNNSENSSTKDANPPIQQPSNQPPTKEELSTTDKIEAGIAGIGAAAAGLYMGRKNFMVEGKDNGAIYRNLEKDEKYAREI